MKPFFKILGMFFFEIIPTKNAKGRFFEGFSKTLRNPPPFGGETFLSFKLRFMEMDWLPLPNTLIH